MFYSAQTGGFYDPAIHGDNIPADAVEITCEQHVELLQGQSQGKVITCDGTGHPCLQDPPPPCNDVLTEACKAEANRRLEETDWSQLPDVVAVIGNKADFDSYRAAVRSIFLNPVPEPVWPERPEAVWL